MSLIKFTGITKTFKTQRDTLFKRSAGIQSVNKGLYHHISGEISQGDLIHLTGPNGSGKTTLLKIIAGIILPDEGSVINSTSGIAIFEDSVFHPELTLEENFYLFSGLHGVSSKASKQLFIKLMDTTDWISSFKTKYLSLSQGQRSIFALEVSFLLNPNLLILDEPFANMDENNRNNAFLRIKTFTEKGGAVILTSHPTEGITAEKIWKIENKELHFL